MEVNNVFGLFDSEQGEPKQEKLSNTTQSPYIFVGLFTRMMLYVDLLNTQTEKVLKKLDSDIDTEKLVYVNKMITFARAYDLISQFNFNDPEHIEVLLDVDPLDFSQACDKMLETLTHYEEYEKCAFIKELKDFVNFSQNKLPL